MAFLNLRKKKDTSVVPTATPASVKKLSISPSVNARGDISRALSRTLIRPHITEKGALLKESRGYAFRVATRSTKREIAAAIRTLYKVIPVKIAVVPIRAKEIKVKGKSGWKGGGKKAYVYLKEGDKIEVM